MSEKLSLGLTEKNRGMVVARMEQFAKVIKSRHCEEEKLRTLLHVSELHLMTSPEQTLILWKETCRRVTGNDFPKKTLQIHS